MQTASPCDGSGIGRLGAEPGLAGIRALIVEDSWHVALAMQAVMEAAGVVVTGPAGSIARAETLLAAGRPDIAVVDINVKGHMSYDLIEGLVARGVPVVVVSGYEDSGRLAGLVAETLRKPVRASALLAAMRRALAGAVRGNDTL